jgi:hypothetical protein
MNLKTIVSACAVGAILAATAADAQTLAKRGSYAGKFSWSEHATVVPVEKDHMYTDAVNQGQFLNAAGSGFLHGAVVVCTSQGAIHNDQFEFSGRCAATDKDGDKALLKWACSRGGDRCTGTFEWTGGTGKYVGMRGGSQFDGGVIGQGPLGTIGDSNWKGEWELP